MRIKNKCVLIAHSSGKPTWLCEAYDGLCKFGDKDGGKCPHLRGEDRCTSDEAHGEILRRIKDIDPKKKHH